MKAAESTAGGLRRIPNEKENGKVFRNASAPVCLPAGRHYAHYLSVFLFLLHWLGIGKENILMLFIVGVLLVAYCTNGYPYGVTASVVSVMVFNYLFTEPVRTFSISNQDDVILLLFFLVAALISSNLTVRFRKQVEVARKNEQLAEQLTMEQERIKFAMEKEQMRSNLLRSISHDLRTPLTGIAGASSLIAESGDKMDPESIMSLGKDINEQADWLIQLVENILNMTKIDSGKLVVEKKPEAVEDVITNALAYVKGRRKQRRVEIDIPEEMLLVKMDGKMIVQVLINLLDNAIKHTKEDGVILIKAQKEDKGVWFYVEDDGTGIEEKIKERIFDEFVTFRPVSRDTGKGIGLGLAICKAIVTAHGGTIDASNREEGGASFRFFLPFEDRNGKDSR